MPVQKPEAACGLRPRHGGGGGVEAVATARGYGRLRGVRWTPAELSPPEQDTLRPPAGRVRSSLPSQREREREREREIRWSECAGDGARLRHSSVNAVSTAESQRKSDLVTL